MRQSYLFWSDVRADLIVEKSHFQIELSYIFNSCNWTSGQVSQKLAMCCHKNEGDEKKSGRKTSKTEMDNPSFV